MTARATHRLLYAIAWTTNALNAPKADALAVTQIAPYGKFRLVSKVINRWQHYRQRGKEGRFRVALPRSRFPHLTHGTEVFIKS